MLLYKRTVLLVCVIFMYVSAVAKLLAMPLTSLAVSIKSEHCYHWKGQSCWNTLDCESESAPQTFPP